MPVLRRHGGGVEMKISRRGFLAALFGLPVLAKVAPSPKPVGIVGAVGHSGTTGLHTVTGSVGFTGVTGYSPAMKPFDFSISVEDYIQHFERRTVDRPMYRSHFMDSAPPRRAHYAHRGDR